MDKASNFLCLTGSPDEPSSYLLTPGMTVLHGSSGVFISDAGAKGLSMTLPFITGVAIADGLQVAEFREELDDTHRTQHLRFHDGTRTTIVYDLDGSVLGVDLERTHFSILPSGLMVLQPSPSGGIGPDL